MTNEVREQIGAPFAWWRRWPSWVGFAATVWASLYGCVVLVAAAAGHRQFVDVSYLAWPAAAVLLGGAVAGAATTRGPRRRLSRRTVSAAVWTVAALSLAGCCWVFVATALSWRRRTAGVCTRCGQAHSSRMSGRRWPDPRPAPLPVRRVAYAGCAIFVPYLVFHALGAAGVAGIEPDGFRPPWLIAPTLALYGTGSFVYAFFTRYGVLGLGGAASVAFGGYGWALGIAAVSYQNRTRPTCALSGPLSTPVSKAA